MYKRQVYTCNYAVVLGVLVIDGVAAYTSSYGRILLYLPFSTTASPSSIAVYLMMYGKGTGEF